MTPDIPNAASVALIRGGEVLLIQRAHPPFQHLWTLPGGRVEPGETAMQCARREIGEELGLRLGPLTPVTRLVLAEGRFLLQVFAATEFSGAPVPSEEVLAFAWTGREAAGALATTPDLDMVLARAFGLVAGAIDAH
jgi:8-oxo-dGTP pyrophosphatase MutT (NUDIX family)